MPPANARPAIARVALIDPSLFTWPYDHALMDGLRACGVDTRVYGKVLERGEAPGLHAGLVEHFYPLLAHRPVSAAPRAVRRVLKGLDHGISLARLLGRLRRWRPDAIHVQWAPLPVIDRRFVPALRRIAPTVMTVHDSLPFNGNPGARLQQVGALAILRLFDALIVHTDQSRRRLTAQGIDPACIHLVPHGLLGDDFGALAALSPAATAAGGQVNLLMFGKIKPYKGVDTVIDALALMPPEHRALCHVRVAGEPHMDMAPLVARAEQRGVADRIAFDLRIVPEGDLPTLFGSATALVLPYRAIDASGVLTMAIQAGRPVIASNIGSFAELLDDGANALLVPPDDPSALAVAIGRYVADATLRGGLAAGVRSLRARMPAWTDIGRKTIGVYESARAQAHEGRAADQRPLAGGSEHPRIAGEP